jgi:hypothetical protein
VVVEPLDVRRPNLERVQPTRELVEALYGLEVIPGYTICKSFERILILLQKMVLYKCELI